MTQTFFKGRFVAIRPRPARRAWHKLIKKLERAAD
jgi:hypothetical protein